MSRRLLMIFVRNPELGKVKTRLASTIGNEKALEVYYALLQKTKSAVQFLPFDKIIYYDDHIDQDDLWLNNAFAKSKQIGLDLGERMSKAFIQGFDIGYDSICIIGSDCFDITDRLIEDAFNAIEKNDFVIGPARDGGYYLLGMRTYHASLFDGIPWSTSSVLPDTIKKINAIGGSYHLLSELTDIDEEKDLFALKDFLKYD